MIIDLKNTFLFGKSIEIKDYQTSPKEIDLKKSNLFISKIKSQISIYSEDENVFIKHSVNLLFSGVCDRCAEKLVKDLNFCLLRPIKISKETDFLDDEINLSDHKLDLDALIKSDILSKFPDIILCKENCKGICPKCYKNLNEHNCKCNKKIIDPRLKILENLL